MTDRVPQVLVFLMQLVIIGLIVGLAWSLTKPCPVFVIRIESGIPRIVRGKVAGALLKTISEVCRQNSVMSGTIRGFRYGR